MTCQANKILPHYLENNLHSNTSSCKKVQHTAKTHFVKKFHLKLFCKMGMILKFRNQMVLHELQSHQNSTSQKSFSSLETFLKSGNEILISKSKFWRHRHLTAKLSINISQLQFAKKTFVFLQSGDSSKLYFKPCSGMKCTHPMRSNETKGARACQKSYWTVT